MTKLKSIILATGLLAIGLASAACSGGGEPEQAAEPMSAEEMQSKGIGMEQAPDGGGGGSTAPESSAATPPTELGQ